MDRRGGGPDVTARAYFGFFLFVAAAIVLLWWLVGCKGGERAPRPAEIIDSAAPAPPPPRLSVTATVLTTLDTTQLDSTVTRKLDSVRVGDTVSYKRGYAVDKTLRTTRTVVDSQWVVFPPPEMGIPVGLFHLPSDSLGKGLGYNAVAFTVDAASLAARLATVRKAKGYAVLLLPRGKSIVNGAISVAGMTAAIRSWDSAAVAKGLRDSTIIDINVADDILADDWGKAIPLKTRLARFDSAGLAVRRRWPTAPVSMRARASQIQGATFKGITVLWWQYNGTYRDGPPARFAQAVADSSASLRLGVMLGLNLLDGGCGPASAQPSDPARRCPPGILGTSAPGSWGKSDSAAVANHRFEMSGAEVGFYGATFVALAANCASINWQWSPVLYSQLNDPRWTRLRAYHSDPAVRAAAKTIGVAARARPATSCAR